MANKNFTVRANIHTIEIRTTEKIDVSQIVEDTEQSGNGELAARINRCVNTTRSRKNPNAKKKGTQFILNLNEWYEDGSEIYLYSEFTEILEQMIAALGLEGNYIVTRADLKFDSTEPSFYEDNKKIIRLVMTEIAYKLRANNIWQSIDGLTLEQRSLKWQTSDTELEYYNKRIESKGESPTEARLELRLTNRIKWNATAKKYEGIRDMRESFDIKLRQLTRAVVDPETGKPDVATAYLRCNENLLSYWKDGNYTSAIDFLRHDRFRELIFTRKQLREFLRLTYSTDDLKIEGWIKNNVDRKKGKLTKYDFCDARDIPSLCDCLMMASEKFFKN